MSLKYISNCPIDNKAALVQVMAWHQTGTKPLPESVLTRFKDAILHHQTSVRQIKTQHWGVCDNDSDGHLAPVHWGGYING